MQQELRVSHAVEVMTQHVENLRHLYDREHAELEEARRVLASHKLALQEPGAAKTGPPGRRRASIAVFAAARGAAANGEARLPMVATPGGSPTNHLMLKRRRNSADGKRCGDEQAVRGGKGGCWVLMRRGWESCAGVAVDW